MKKDKIIIHSITRMYLGGAQRICADILINLKNNDENVLLLTGKEERLFYKIKKEGINYKIIPELDRAINPIKDIIAFIKILFFLRKIKKRYRDIYLHTHTSKAGFIVRLAGGLNNIKNIYHTAHGWSFFKGQNKLEYCIYTLLERVMLKFTKSIIAVSQHVKNMAVEANIGNNDNYTVIYNGIRKMKKYDNEKYIKKDLNIPFNKNIVLQVSCFRKAKSPLTFVKIAHYFKNDNNKFFILAGDGPLRKKIESYILKNNLKNILLTGWYKDVEELYSIANICVLTSIFEGAPLTILEALSYKIPIIATGIPPHRELLDNDYLCNTDDIKCFAEKINQYINIDNVNNKFNYKYNDMLKEYEKLYK